MRLKLGNEIEFETITSDIMVEYKSQKLSRSGKHLISPNNITPKSCSKVMRIKKIISS